MEKDVNKEVLKFYVNELKQLNDVLQHELLAQKEKVKSLRKDKKIVFNLKACKWVVTGGGEFLNSFLSRM